MTKDTDADGWTIGTAYKNRRQKIKVESPTGKRFYLSPMEAERLGKEIVSAARHYTYDHD